MELDRRACDRARRSRDARFDGCFSGLVSRALRLISEGALDEDGVERLAERLGVTGRHLRRLFRQHLGATPLTSLGIETRDSGSENPSLGP